MWLGRPGSAAAVVCWAALALGCHTSEDEVTIAPESPAGAQCQRPERVAATEVPPFLAQVAGSPRAGDRYVPRKPHAGDRANLPPVPRLPERPLRAGEAYTVWGASYSLRHRALRDRINEQTIRLRGVIGKTNLMSAPACAVHPPGQGDPPDCRADIPTFWLCDHASDRLEDCIQVLGWASNYAQLYAALQKYANAPTAEHIDDYWGMPIPNPVPAAGAEVTVTGKYSAVFTRSSTGASADPIMGLVTYQSIEYHRPAPRPARLPK